VWIEDTSDPDAECGDRYDDMMEFHALVLGRDAAGQPFARYGQIYASNYGTDESYGEGTFHRTEHGIDVVLPALSDWSNAAGTGYDCRRSLIRARRFEFRPIDEGESSVLVSYLNPGAPTVPEARFVRVADAAHVLAEFDVLAERDRERRRRAADDDDDAD
jgi:hypothetical protein